jgi:hypothetical protein
MFSLEDLVTMPEPELARVDPVYQDLAVARGITSLATLNVVRYQAQVDGWAADIEERLPGLERQFWETPETWKDDINFFRLGVLCWYLDVVLGVRYREDEREAKGVLYTDPSALFLNGVIDTRQGTCGNMATLYFALAWRLGWPVSMARAGYHSLARYEAGCVAYNIETTNTGNGGFASEPDSYYIRNFSYSRRGFYVGVDLRLLKPREVLGTFVGKRGRHYCDSGLLPQALREYTLAHHLYPTNPIFEDAAVEAAGGWRPIQGPEQVRCSREFIASITTQVWVRPGES